MAPRGYRIGGGMGGSPVVPPKPAAVGTGKTVGQVPTGTKPSGVTSDLDVPGVAQDAPNAAWGTTGQAPGRPKGAALGAGVGGLPPGHGGSMPTPTAGTNVMKDMIEGSKSRDKMDVMGMDDAAWRKLLAKFGAFD